MGGCTHASQELVGVLAPAGTSEERPEASRASSTTSFSGRFVSQRLRVENRAVEARALRQDGKALIFLESCDSSKAELTAPCLCPQSVRELQPQVDELTRSSNNIYNYISSVSSSLRERQRVISGPKGAARV